MSVPDTAEVSRLLDHLGHRIADDLESEFLDFKDGFLDRQRVGKTFVYRLAASDPTVASLLSQASHKLKKTLL